MTESAADIRQRVDSMIDTLRCQRDAAETRAETYYYAYTKALHRVEAAEAKLAAIRALCDADDFDIETARLLRILDGAR